MSILSPATEAGLKLFSEISASTEVKKEREYTYVDPVYPCPICGETHDDEDDALDCCQSEEEERPAFHEQCPVCRTEHFDTHAAANCCLWKDLTVLQRFLIANDVEAGSTWTDAINRHKDIDPLKA